MEKNKRKMVKCDGTFNTDQQLEKKKMQVVYDVFDMMSCLTQEGRGNGGIGGIVYCCV